MPAFDFQSYITDIPDYPKPGVIFKDVTTLFKDPEGFTAAIDAIAEHFEGKGITKVVGAEARGFMIGAPVAYRLHAGFVPARKPGKLPRETRSESYELEYGSDSLEMHLDAIDENDIVLVVDDLIATGGNRGCSGSFGVKSRCQSRGFCFLIGACFLEPSRSSRTKLHCRGLFVDFGRLG